MGRGGGMKSAAQAGGRYIKKRLKKEKKVGEDVACYVEIDSVVAGMRESFFSPFHPIALYSVSIEHLPSKMTIFTR